jgi:hypothetical protein
MHRIILACALAGILDCARAIGSAVQICVHHITLFHEQVVYLD